MGFPTVRSDSQHKARHAHRGRYFNFSFPSSLSISFPFTLIFLISFPFFSYFFLPPPPSSLILSHLISPYLVLSFIILLYVFFFPSSLFYYPYMTNLLPVPILPPLSFFSSLLTYPFSSLPHCLFFSSLFISFSFY